MKTRSMALFALGSLVCLASSADAQVVDAWGDDLNGKVSGAPSGTAFQDVAGGYQHSVALRLNGSLHTWGAPSAGFGMPTGTGFTQISAYGNASAALAASGSIVVWGDDGNGVVSGAPLTSGNLDVDLGLYAALALRADRSIEAWGTDSFGQLSGVPAGTGFLDISAGRRHAVAIRSDGSLVAWGEDNDGSVSNAPSGVGFVQVSAGEWHSVALKADGSIAAWGDDSYQQVSTAPTGTGFTQVVAGGWHSLALRSDGSVVAWGAVSSPVFPVDSGQVSDTPATLDFTSIGAGSKHSLGTRIPDCNGNGLPDYDDISTGASLDCNGNGIPDTCDLASGFSMDIDGDGLLDDCVVPPLTADTYELAISTGGVQTFSLKPGAGHFLDPYLLLGSTSGVAPGISLGSLVLPLQPDAYFAHTLANPNGAPLTGSFGLMLSGQTLSATFTLPPALGPAFVGLTVHHAFVAWNPLTGVANEVSNAVPTLLLP